MENNENKEFGKLFNSVSLISEEHLIKCLKDVLEDDVDGKYFLSENTIEKLIDYDIKHNRFP